MTSKRKSVNKTFDYTSLLVNYSLAFDHNNLNILMVDLDLKYVLTAFNNLTAKDILKFKWPGIEAVKEYALNVFEGCCYSEMTLKEKKLTVVAALFRFAKVNKARKLILAELNRVNKATESELEFIEEALKLSLSRSKPAKNSFTVKHVLWDAINMHLYNPNMGIDVYLYNLVKTDKNLALEKSTLLKTEAITNWAKVKHFKLDWPARIKHIFGSLDKLSWATSLL
jgi:hypothetical protein